MNRDYIPPDCIGEFRDLHNALLGAGIESCKARALRILGTVSVDLTVYRCNCRRRVTHAPIRIANVDHAPERKPERLRVPLFYYNVLRDISDPCSQPTVNGPIIVLPYVKQSTARRLHGIRVPMVPVWHPRKSGLTQNEKINGGTMRMGGSIVVVLRNIRALENDEYIQRISGAGFQVRQVPLEENPQPAIDELAPLVTCFQYDYPDLRGLAELRLAKERMPSVPLIMITQEHSESLAVWAFRTRVWDYFVQPVEVDRLLAVLEILSAARFADRRDRPLLPNTDLPTNAIPREARLRGGSPTATQALLEQAISYVDRNLHKKIIQAEVAEICGLSPFQFSRLFKREYETTFQEYVLQKRITEAMRMLGHPEASVTDVCFNTGFRDLSYFTRMFRRYVGQTPSKYRLSVAQASGQPDRTQPRPDGRQQEPRMEGEREALSLDCPEPEYHRH